MGLFDKAKEAVSRLTGKGGGEAGPVFYQDNGGMTGFRPNPFKKHRNDETSYAPVQQDFSQWEMPVITPEDSGDAGYAYDPYAQQPEMNGQAYDGTGYGVPQDQQYTQYQSGYEYDPAYGQPYGAGQQNEYFDDMYPTGTMQQVDPDPQGFGATVYGGGQYFSPAQNNAFGTPQMDAQSTIYSQGSGQDSYRDNFFRSAEQEQSAYQPVPTPQFETQLPQERPARTRQSRVREEERGRDNIVYMNNAANTQGHVTWVAQIAGLRDCFRLMEYMRNGETVLVNAEDVSDPYERERCLDLLCGAAYAMNATYTLAANDKSIFLITPSFVEVKPYESIRWMNTDMKESHWPGLEQEDPRNLQRSRNTYRESAGDYRRYAAR